jgi:hypothetical protein
VVTKCLAAVQIFSPSGKAIFKLTNMVGNPLPDYVDLVICRFPEPHNLNIPDGTVTAYRNSIFIWFAFAISNTPDHLPGNPHVCASSCNTCLHRLYVRAVWAVCV